ncbi:F-box domain-containing protein [Mycena sanguinolenta]|uniref:F-box domain-containing protein n=1 Tax=Mycena sanguinolenta TaxID=230812 RepID=A0A8H6ZIZ2_9AGAR|nr:F-box domain-containing protein [Mycena sanguinolenta]
MSTKSSRAADRAHIAEIDAKILVLRHSIQLLEAEKMCTQERLNEYMYPVLTLPNETVAEIFIHFLPAYPSPPPMTGPLSPTVLTHICHTWREIAFTTPALWRGISYPDRSESRSVTSDQGGLLQILQSWLSRSGCLPLSFCMAPVAAMLSDESLAALNAHHTRWEHITFVVEADADALRAQGATPLLKQLEIEPCSDKSLYFGEAPQLRSATVWRFSTVLPWSQLTSLTLICRPFDCSAILRHAVNLIHCHLALLGDSEVLEDDVELSSLESLILTQEGVDDAPTQYLGTLITPALRTLEVPEAFLEPYPIATLQALS